MQPNERALQVRQRATSEIANVAFDYESSRQLFRGRSLLKQRQRATAVLQEFSTTLQMHPWTTCALRQGCTPCDDLANRVTLQQ